MRVAVGLLTLMVFATALPTLLGYREQCAVPIDTSPTSVTLSDHELNRLRELGYVGGQDEMLEGEELMQFLEQNDTEESVDMQEAFAIVEASRGAGRQAVVTNEEYERLRGLGYTGEQDEVDDVTVTERESNWSHLPIWQRLAFEQLDAAMQQVQLVHLMEFHCYFGDPNAAAPNTWLDDVYDRIRSAVTP